jgi:hypothetical protein
MYVVGGFMHVIEKKFLVNNLEAMVQYRWDAATAQPVLMDVKVMYKGRDVTPVLNKKEKAKLWLGIYRILNANKAEVEAACR